MENESSEQNSNKQYLQEQISFLSEELCAQRIMLQDALVYATHLEGKLKSLSILSDALQNQLIELKNTTDKIHYHANIIS